MTKKYPVGIVYEGGPGSGHHGHAGRPGSRGGSSPGTATGGGLSGISLPKDLTKMTVKQRRQVVNQLVKKPLADLRKRQDLVRAQQKKAFEGYTKAKTGAERTKWEKASDNLTVQEEILFDAVNKIAEG